MSFRLRAVRRRRPAPDPAAAMRGQVADLDVADINTVRLRPLANLDAQRAEITRVIEAWAATGAVDRATGGHLLDERIDHLGEEETAAINGSYSRQLSTAAELIGAAEAGAERARGLLDCETSRHALHLALANRARTELFGDLAPAVHSSNGEPTRHDCPDLDPWIPPWMSALGPDGVDNPGVKR